MREADCVGSSSSCLDSGGDSAAAGRFLGPGEKARGGVRKMKALVSQSGVLLTSVGSELLAL